TEHGARRPVREPWADRTRAKDQDEQASAPTTCRAGSQGVTALSRSASGPWGPFAISKGRRRSTTRFLPALAQCRSRRPVLEAGWGSPPVKSTARCNGDGKTLSPFSSRLIQPLNAGNRRAINANGTAASFPRRE